MGQKAIKLKSTRTATSMSLSDTNGQNEHYCSLQMGSLPSISLELNDIQYQFGSTYVYFKIPRDKLERCRYQKLDLKYQRYDARTYDNLSSEEMIEHINSKHDGIIAYLSTTTSKKNIINGTEYQEYRIASEKNNSFTIRYPMEGKHHGIIVYQYIHN